MVKTSGTLNRPTDTGGESPGQLLQNFQARSSGDTTKRDSTVYRFALPTDDRARLARRDDVVGVPMDDFPSS